MKQIRKIVNNYKGLVTFVLVLFFLTTGFAKGLTAKGASHFKKETALKNASKQNVSQFVEDQSPLSFLDQLNDSDINDGDFVLFNNFDSSFAVAVIGGQANFAGFPPVTKQYTISLYDLYCNWKFHLS
jgi:hypothetical protein